MSDIADSPALPSIRTRSASRTEIDERLSSGDELVFIGPGSEWFWATIGSIVTAVSLIAIFRRLLRS